MRKGLNVKLLLSALLATSIAASAAPFDVTGGGFRKLPGKLPAAGYFTARNNSRRDVAITDVRTIACGMVMMHRSSAKGGMCGMDMVDKVTIPAGGAVTFAPGGYHLMCDDPKMKIGARVPVLLSLSDGSTVAVGFEVRGAAGK
jgi:copper(I)-binding protein